VSAVYLAGPTSGGRHCVSAVFLLGARLLLAGVLGVKKKGLIEEKFDAACQP
jgi:hypothetical protein